MVIWQTAADFICYGACDDFVINEVHSHRTLLCLIQVISNTIIYKGLVALQLITFNYVGNFNIFSACNFLLRLILERISANLQHLYTKLSDRAAYF